MTYPYNDLKAIIYHEYFNFLYNCYHGYDEPVKRIWNPRKENAELYYKVYRDLERVFEMALRCFKDEEPLISFLEREIDRTLSMFDKKLKPKVVSGFLEVEEKVLSEEDKYLHERAKRLARALARDIINYYGPKVEQGLREGNLLEILKDVIEKSRKYYEEKIPEHIRKNTRYFEDAFNEIVAKGRKIL